MAADKDHPSVRFPPPLVFLGFLLLGPVIDRQLDWAVLPGGGLRQGVGALLVLAGIALALSAIGLFRRVGENPEPWTGTTTLVRDGVYRFTRNPMYLGMAVVHLGIALILGSTGALLTLLLAVFVIDRFVIPAEESYLMRRLGDEYLTFRSKVRRWL